LANVKQTVSGELIAHGVLAASDFGGDIRGRAAGG
jgi:hypothetical protein